MYGAERGGAYDPFDPLVIADPYPTYARLRGEDPVHEMAPGTWAVSRFDDIWRCFTLPAALSNSAGITGSQLLERRIGPFAALANLDDPTHRARRGAVKAEFTPAKAASLRAHCQQVCRDALEPLRDGQPIDATLDYGLRLSVAVVAELLGIPPADRAAIGNWIRDIFYRPPADHGLSAVGLEAYARLSDYCVELATAQRTAGPTSDVVRSYLGIMDDTTGPLGDTDLGSHLREILIGGAETNPKALGAAITRLAADPIQRAEVIADPELARPAFQEAVRIDTPGQFIGRTATSTIELAGHTIAEHDVVLLLIAAGNRDEREFAEPDTFDIHRQARRSLAFGQGVHFCIGRHLAVLEGEVALQELLDVAPAYEVRLHEATRANHEMVHGYTRLPLEAAA